MKSKNYYGIYGSNGCGVYTSWSKACDALKYLYKSRAKRFNTFRDAQVFAIEGLMNYYPYKTLPDELPINFTVYAKACPDIM